MTDAERVEADRLMEQWPAGLRVKSQDVAWQWHRGLREGVTTGYVEFFSGVAHIGVCWPLCSLMVRADSLRRL